MSKLKSHYHVFLEEGGAKLGFSMDFLPPIEDINDILVNQMDAQTYSELKEECNEEHNNTCRELYHVEKS